jgi:hypothetical protein
MNIDLLRAFAPELAVKPEIRARIAEYFRVLALNYADFRLEPFLYLVAAQFTGLTDAQVLALCDGLEPAAFPELLAGKSAALKEKLAQEQCERLLQAVASSRWMALGRLFGAAPRLMVHAPTAHARLAALRKSCTACAWYRLGQRLGLVYAETE